MTRKEIREYYKSIFGRDIANSSLSQWIKQGKIKATKLDNRTYDYDFESFKAFIESDSYKKKSRASKEKPENYIGKRIHDLEVLSIVPKNEYKWDYQGTLMYCKCLRCGTITQVRFTYLTKNGNYTQFSCGCARKERAFLASSREDLTEEHLKPFQKNFEKFLLVHKLLTSSTDKYYTTCPIEEYVNALNIIYKDSQFNAIYDFWLKSERVNAFYDWAKPSLDHIIPKSKGGTHKIDNLQILTVFENLAKRDLSMQEWNEFKQKTHSTSDYFVENIIKEKGGKDYE